MAKVIPCSITMGDDHSVFTRRVGPDLEEIQDHWDEMGPGDCIQKEADTVVWVSWGEVVAICCFNTPEDADAFLLDPPWGTCDREHFDCLLQDHDINLPEEGFQPVWQQFRDSHMEFEAWWEKYGDQLTADFGGQGE